MCQLFKWAVINAIYSEKDNMQVWERHNHYTVKQSVDFTVKHLETSCQSISRYFSRASACRILIELKMGRVRFTENTRKYLLRFKGYMTKSNTCVFATLLCLIPDNVNGRP